MEENTSCMYVCVGFLMSLMSSDYQSPFLSIHCPSVFQSSLCLCILDSFNPSNCWFKINAYFGEKSQDSWVSKMTGWRVLSRYGQGFPFYATAFRPVLGPTHTLTQWLSDTFPKVCNSQSIKLTTHLNLIPMLRMYRSLPPWHGAFIAVLCTKSYMSVRVLRIMPQRVCIADGGVWPGMHHASSEQVNKNPNYIFAFTNNEGVYNESLSIGIMLWKNFLHSFFILPLALLLCLYLLFHCSLLYVFP